MNKKQYDAAFKVAMTIGKFVRDKYWDKKDVREWSDAQKFTICYTIWYKLSDNSDISMLLEQTMQAPVKWFTRADLPRNDQYMWQAFVYGITCGEYLGLPTEESICKANQILAYETAVRFIQEWCIKELLQIGQGQ